MEFFFEVDDCVVLFTIDDRPESRLWTGKSYSKINSAA